MHFYPNEKLALFIDGADLHHAARSLDFRIDFRKLLSHFRQKGRLIRAYYYTVLREDDEGYSVRPLVDWLDYNGFTVITKPAREQVDASGRRRTKGNMDVELTVDALRFAANVDHIILFTGDDDFRALVTSLQDKGNRVSVVSTMQTQPPMIATELRRQADQFIDLDDLEPAIAQSHDQRAVQRENH